MYEEKEQIMKKLILCALTMALFISGCATTSSKKLLPGAIWVKTAPVVKCEKDPDVNFGKYKNFTVFRQAEINTALKMSPIIEKQLLFMVRNNFELLGYDYVDSADNADFVVAVSYSNEYKTEYIPPSSVTVPWYIPGQTQTTYLNASNNTFGSIGSTNFFGSGSGTGTATTTSSGYYIPTTVQIPGRYEGYYYPVIYVDILDKITKKLVWSGSAVTTTTESDIRLSVQALLFFNLLSPGAHNFPAYSDLKDKYKSTNGTDGVLPIINTSDGNNFYPIIFGVIAGSPADKAGLRPRDILTKIDGKDTLNLSLAQVGSLLRKNQGESAVLEYKRDDSVSDVTLLFVDKAIAKNNPNIITLNNDGNVTKVKVPEKM